MFTTIENAKKIARELQRNLADSGIHAKLSDCQEMVAKKMEYVDWHQMVKFVQSGKPNKIAIDRNLAMIDMAREFRASSEDPKSETLYESLISGNTLPWGPVEEDIVKRYFSESFFTSPYPSLESFCFSRKNVMRFILYIEERGALDRFSVNFMDDDVLALASIRRKNIRSFDGVKSVDKKTAEALFRLVMDSAYILTESSLKSIIRKDPDTITRSNEQHKHQDTAKVISPMLDAIHKSLIDHSHRLLKIWDAYSDSQRPQV